MRALIAALVILTASHAMAADDPSIRGDLRAGIQHAMMEHVAANTFDGKYILYDAVEGELLRLDFDSLHDGIVQKGDFYVACADFHAADGTYYDLDMLVADNGGGLRVLQSIVHKKGDVKRRYHVEN